jgi:hypothetical protein
MNFNKSTFTGLLFALFAVACILVIPGQISVMDIYGDELSPRVFPYILASAILLLSVLIIWLHRKDPAVTRGIPSLTAETKYALAGMAVSCCIAAGVYLFGMIPVTTAVMLALCVLLGCRNILVLGGMTVGWVLFAHLVFEVAFNFALPKGTVFS